MATLVDTNILVDVFHAGSAWRDWSEARLEAARRSGPVIINPLIYAEMSAGFATVAGLDEALDPRKFQRDDLPWEAAFAAGKVYLAYRRSHGDKRSPLPDFYIGAHAAAKGYVLLTRDASRYRTYFPSLSIIAPDTHP